MVLVVMGAFVGYFYPRSPCGERLGGAREEFAQKMISIHALLAESDVDMSSAYPAVQCISIHALLAESDAQALSVTGSESQISIHALLAESDLKNAITAAPQQEFLSTLSLRRATQKRRVL